MYLFRKFLVACSICGVSWTNAAPVVEQSDCPTHFTMELNTSLGEWETYAKYPSEDGTVVDPSNNCEKIAWFTDDPDNPGKKLQTNRSKTVSPGTPLNYGHQNGTYSDFYGVLSITMTQQPDEMTKHEHYKKQIVLFSKGLLKRAADLLAPPPPKMCIFYIGASGPAEPKQAAFGFEGAACSITLNPKTRGYLITAN